MSLNQHDKDDLRLAHVRLHRTIPMRAPGNANPAFATDPGRVGPSSRHADDGVDAGGCADNLNARALLPVAGRW
jgi:hypothetical protein